MNLERFVRTAGELRALAVKVVKDGEEIARHEWEPVIRRNLYSASKSFTSAAVGIAQGERPMSQNKQSLCTVERSSGLKGRLIRPMSAKLLEPTIPELEGKLDREKLLDIHGRSRERQIALAKEFGIGHDQAWLMGAQRAVLDEEDWVRFALSRPFVHTPGTTFVYNNACTYLAGILVQQRAGCDLLSYLMPRLFKPLGIYRPTWETDPLGRTFGASGLMLTIDELARFGQLYLQNGSWNGRQLVPAAWVKESTSVQIDNGSYGYGYQFWAGPHGSFRADGMYAQLSILMRDKNAVVTTVAESRHADKLIEAVFEEIYPQL